MQSNAGVSRPDPCQNQVLHINVYKGLTGFTSSSGHEAADTLWPFLIMVSQPENLIFSRGDFFLNQAPPSK